MKKFFVTPYVLDRKESLKVGVPVLVEGDRKQVEAETTVSACLKHRPRGTSFWHVRKVVH